ncbi:TRAP transporter small permease subunit [Thioclava sp. GXIMD2076]|uniref:TRAP transporter small permease n=1 Tax=unclassified Thioclava TaxID=2621713 RepID=UPI0030CA6B49
MTTLLTLLQRVLLVLCCALVVVIIGALSVQIVSRYVFNAPVHMTDDIAEISLVWLTFMGAAIVYRDKGHIGVEIIASMKNAAIRRAVHISQHVLVVAVMVEVLFHVQHLYPLMSRLEVGTVPKTLWTTKFTLILLPFGVGAGLTILFALEGIWREITGKALPVKGTAE